MSDTPNPQLGSLPPMISVPPSSSAGIPPSPPSQLTPHPSSLRQLLVILLSVCIGLFLVDAVVSLADETLILAFGLHVLSAFNAMAVFFTMLLAIPIYCLMGLTPMIPKRLFIPVTLFNPLAILAIIPFLIFFFPHAEQVAWLISFFQVMLGLGMLYWLQGGLKLRWPLVGQDRLGSRCFTWLNLSVFLLVNVFVLLPAFALYLVCCTSMAVDHFSASMLSLRPGGLIVQVRKYVREDGKTIQLVPMAHVGDASFYQRLSQSFPTNSTILMEGVTDRKHLLTNGISYKRMATSLGLSEQKQEFNPPGEIVWADVDVEQFSPNTLDLLNLVMLIHSKGVNVENVRKLLEYSPPPHLEGQLFADLLGKRNRHLLDEIQVRLPVSENIVVPWGVAHMPELVREIEKSGFRLDKTQDFVVIRFTSAGKKSARLGTPN